jgi:hypothetical protein
MTPDIPLTGVQVGGGKYMYSMSTKREKNSLRADLPESTESPIQETPLRVLKEPEDLPV